MDTSLLGKSCNEESDHMERMPYDWIQNYALHARTEEQENKTMPLPFLSGTSHQACIKEGGDAIRSSCDNIIYKLPYKAKQRKTKTVQRFFEMPKGII